VRRYRSKGVLLGKIRPKIKWADVEAVKAELQVQLDRLLGGITEEDLREPEKKKKKKVSLDRHALHVDPLSFVVGNAVNSQTDRGMRLVLLGTPTPVTWV
jgi:hypothetical protein